MNSGIIWHLVRTISSLVVPGDERPPGYSDTLHLEVGHACVQYVWEGSALRAEYKVLFHPGDTSAALPEVPKGLFEEALFQGAHYLNRNDNKAASTLFDSLEVTFWKQKKYYASVFFGIQSVKAHIKEHPSNRVKLWRRLDSLMAKFQPECKTKLDSFLLHDLYFFQAKNLIEAGYCHFGDRYLKKCARFIHEHEKFSSEFDYLAGMVALGINNVDIALSHFYKSSHFAFRIKNDLRVNHTVVVLQNNLGITTAYSMKGVRPAVEHYLSESVDLNLRFGFNRTLHLKFLEQYINCLKRDDTEKDTLLFFLERAQVIVDGLDSIEMGVNARLVSTIYLYSYRWGIWSFEETQEKLKEIEILAANMNTHRSVEASWVHLNLCRLYFFESRYLEALGHAHFALVNCSDGFNDFNPFHTRHLDSIFTGIIDHDLAAKAHRAKATIYWEMAREENKNPDNDSQVVQILQRSVIHYWFQLQLSEYMMTAATTPAARRLIMKELEGTFENLIYGLTVIEQNKEYLKDKFENKHLLFYIIQRAKARNYLDRSFNHRDARGNQLSGGENYEQLFRYKNVTIKQIEAGDDDWTHYLNAEQIYVRLLIQEINIDTLTRRFGQKRMEKKESMDSLFIGGPQLRTKLNDSTTFIDFHFGKDRIAMAIMNSEHYLIKTLRLTEDFQNQLLELLNLYRSEPKDKNSILRLSELSFWFYETILKSFEVSGDLKKNLIIAPDGLLNFLPFEALLMEKPKSCFPISNWEFLFNTKNIFYAQSASQWYFDQQIGIKEPIQPERASYKMFSTFYERNDSDSIQPFFSSDIQSRYFLGSQFNSDNLFEMGEESTVLHLQCHSIRDTNTENQTFLLLSSDREEEYGTSELEMSQLNMVGLSNSLTILQTCGSGYGEIRLGDGVESIAGLVRTIGVPRVVSALWEIPNAHSNMVLEPFGRKIEGGITSGKGLIQSKREYLKKCFDHEAHPYYWAGLVFHGSDTPVFKKKKSDRAYYLLFLIPLFALSWFGYRRYSTKKHINQAA